MRRPDHQAGRNGQISTRTEPCLDGYLLAVEDDAATCLRTAFAMSYRGLPEQTVRLFRLLGLHDNHAVTTSTAAALFGGSHAQAIRHLETLTDSYPLEDAGRDHYRFHDLVRIYAAECAEDEPVASCAAALSRLSRSGR